jgi:hypothetical protein
MVEAADTELDSTTAEEDEEEEEEEEEDKEKERVWDFPDWDWDSLDNETLAAALAPDDTSMSVSSSELVWCEQEEEESEDDPDMEVPSMGERSSMEFEEGEEEEEEEGEQEEKTEDEPTAVAPAHPAPAMEDDTGQDAALWGWVEPTWFKISVYLLSGKVIVVYVSSRQTFGQVKFWIWVNERILPCQQRLVWKHIEVDDTYWIVESCDVSLVLVDKVYAMYKVVISCPSLDYDLIISRGLWAGDGIKCVLRVIRLAICMWPWAGDVDMFSDDELEELRVLLGRHTAWELGIQAA